MARTVEALSDVAKNKNFLDRILTKNARKTPGDIFDDLIGEIIINRGKDPVAESLKFEMKSESAFEHLSIVLSDKPSNAVKPDMYFEKNLKIAQSEFANFLKKEGFDVKKLGITDMKAP